MLADKIRELRTKNHFSQATFSETVGVTPNTIGKYETRKGIPRQKTLEKICSVYGVTMEWLMEETGSETAHTPERGRPRKDNTNQGFYFSPRMVKNRNH